ncbi:hypothetical protein IGK44_002587 [Enterococcus sp. DIV1248a]
MESFVSLNLTNNNGFKWDDISIDTFIELLDDYLNWYNNNRIKLSLGGLSPINYRKTLGLIA